VPWCGLLVRSDVAGGLNKKVMGSNKSIGDPYLLGDATIFGGLSSVSWAWNVVRRPVFFLDALITLMPLVSSEW
jgi:hypothetical protein